MSYSLCGTSVANLGEQACDKARGVLKKILIFNGNIAAADYADITTFFNKLVDNSKLSKSAANKVFSINEAQDLADASDANKEGSLNLGFKTVLLEGKPGYKAKIFAGADLLKRLRTFNNQTIRIVEFDANGVFWGTKSGTNFRGFQAKLFVTGGKIATGQNVEEGVVELTISILSTSEYFDNAYWMESDGNIDDIRPLIDVNMKYVSNASNVHQIKFEIPGSNLVGPYNVYDESGAALQALTFTAGTGTNFGTSLAISGVALNATLKTLAFTFSSVPYLALAPNTQIKIFPPTPAALDAGDVPDVELIPVIVTNA